MTVKPKSHFNEATRFSKKHRQETEYNSTSGARSRILRVRGMCSVVQCVNIKITTRSGHKKRRVLLTPERDSTVDTRIG